MSLSWTDIHPPTHFLLAADINLFSFLKLLKFTAVEWECIFLFGFGTLCIRPARLLSSTLFLQTTHLVINLCPSISKAKPRRINLLIKMFLFSWVDTIVSVMFMDGNKSKIGVPNISPITLGFTRRRGQYGGHWQYDYSKAEPWKAVQQAILNCRKDE